MTRLDSVCSNSLHRDKAAHSGQTSELIHVTCGVNRFEVQIPRGQCVADAVHSLAGVCNAPINRVSCYVNGTLRSGRFPLAGGDSLDLRATWGRKGSAPTERELLKLVLKHQKLLRAQIQRVEGKLDRAIRPRKRDLPKLTVPQRLILKAVGDDILIGREIAARIGSDLNTTVKASLSVLRKVDVLGHDGRGYYIKLWAKRLLDVAQNN